MKTVEELVRDACVGFTLSEHGFVLSGLERFRDLIRNEVLEEAALEGDHWQSISHTHQCGSYIAGAIRALKKDLQSGR
jgi:hypothetical protein